MENKKLLMGTAMVALSAIALPQKADAITQAVNISAQVYEALAANNPTALNFGAMTVDATAGGTVTVTNAGARTQGGAGGVTLIGSGGAAGVITLSSKEASSPIVYSFAATNAVLSNAATPADTMTVNAFTCDGGLAGADCTTSATVAAAGINIGGTLNVAAAQATGTYTGSLTVNINYQ